MEGTTSAGPAQPIPPPKKGRGRWFKVRVVIAAILLLAAFLLYMNARNNAPPRVLAVLGQGQIDLNVPVMTAYAFPNVTSPGFWAETNYTFAGPSTMTFRWTEVSGTSLPVRFALATGAGDSAFALAPDGGLNYSFGGISGSAGVPDQAVALVSEWVMNYTVREMATYAWFGENRWIEVDYRVTNPGWCFCDLAAAHVSPPGPGDAVAVGSPVHLIVSQSLPWNYGVSLQTVTLPVTTYENTLPSLTIPLGGQGNLTAALASSFAWGAKDGYVMRMGGTGPANVNVQVYLDTRFGSLFAESVT